MATRSQIASTEASGPFPGDGSAPTLKNYIDGSWTAAEPDDRLEDRDPATGELLALVPLHRGPRAGGVVPVRGKDSCDGDLHTNGTDAVDFYTRKKVITSRWK